jgi:hypothetical protein
LLQCWRWRRVGIVVVIVLLSGTVASVGHLMIVKRFETEIVIEIKDEVVDRAHKQPITNTRQTQTSIIQNIPHNKVF